MVRRIVQVLTALLYNLNLPGFASGTIYQGASKAVCVPGLNCYSCPGAIGSCPIGAAQAVLGSKNYSMTYYLVGFFLTVGTVFGRTICGYACPFGLIQELIYKIPFKKVRNSRVFGVLKYGKYLALAVLVIAAPLLTSAITGVGTPAFCKYLCPAGTLEAGIPLLLFNGQLRDAAGWLFVLKMTLLIATVAACVMIYRPFCRFVCPLGAIYGLFNPISVIGIRLDTDACTQCKACERVCKMGVDPSVNPATPNAFAAATASAFVRKTHCIMVQ